MAWSFDRERPKTFEEITAEWQRGLAAKADSDPAEWMKTAGALRSIAAALRDSFLPMSPRHQELVELVDEMSTHLPERRKERRD